MGEIKLSQYLQDSIIYLAITDDKFVSLISGINFEHVFFNPIPQDCLILAIKFYVKYHKAPHDHFQDELTKFVKHKDIESKKQYADFIQRIINNKEPDRQYVLSELNNWLRERKLKNALLDASEIVSTDTDKAASILYKALETEVGEVESGLDFLNDFRTLDKRNDEEEFDMSTGIVHLDKLIGGFNKGRFICIMGEYKGMKSWMLMHIAKTALLNGMNVVHISHEMSEEEVEMRYDQLISGYMVDGKSGANKIPVDADNPLTDWYVNLWEMEENGLVTNTTKVVPSVKNINLVKDNRQRIANLGGSLRIKKYPPKTCSMETLRNYLKYLEHFEGIKPDVIINDYADDMDLSGYNDQLRHQLNDVYLDHKRLADELNCVVVTASQVNRKAIRSPKIDKSHFAEDLRKAGNVDLALGICRSQMLCDMQRANIFVVVNRSGADNVWCQIGNGIQAGQFAIWSQDSKTAKEEEESIMGVEVEDN